MEKIVDEFLAIEKDQPQLLYIWGHSYEMDAGYITREKFEAICEKLSRRTDIFTVRTARFYFEIGFCLII